MLSNSKSELMQIIIERNSYKNYLNLIKIKLDKLRRKLQKYLILILWQLFLNESNIRKNKLILSTIYID